MKEDIIFKNFPIFIEYFKILIKKYPNDQDLGKNIRDIIHKQDEKEGYEINKKKN